MEDISIEKETKNNEENNDQMCEILSENLENLYQINFINNKTDIEISCTNITMEPNKRYVNKFNSYSLNEIMKVNNISKAYEILKGVIPIQTKVQEENNKATLFIKFENQIITFQLNEPKPEPENKPNIESETETKDINDALTLIKLLKNENYELKKRLSEVEKQIEIINLNCEYNLFNIKSHYLENIFKELKKDENCLIKAKTELGLINKGINNVLNKSIAYIEKSYSSQSDGERPKCFKKYYNNSSIYSIIIIETKDIKRFGIFCNKENNEENNEENSEENNEENNLLNNNFIQYKPNLLDIMNDDLNNFNDQTYDNQNMPDPLNVNNNINTSDIFNSNSITNDFFFFSFDNLSLYYSNDNNNVFPKIEIKYDNTRQSLFGTETYNNLPPNKKPKLSGKTNFNIFKYELYYLGLSEN